MNNAPGAALVSSSGSCGHILESCSGTQPRIHLHPPNDEIDGTRGDNLRWEIVWGLKFAGTSAQSLPHACGNLNTRCHMKLALNSSAIRQSMMAPTSATDAIESASSGSLLNRQFSVRCFSSRVLKQMCRQPREEYGHTIS